MENERILARRVYLRRFEEDDGASLVESAGFRREGTLIKDVWFHKDADGEPIWKDTYLYGLLAEEYGV